MKNGAVFHAAASPSKALTRLCCQWGHALLMQRRIILVSGKGADHVLQLNEMHNNVVMFYSDFKQHVCI